jgi:hydroxymethylglutaryl-CoA reductase (NADPH)
MSRADRIPRNREIDCSKEQAARRRELIRKKSGIDLEAVSAYWIDPTITRGNIETFIGTAQVLLGLAGP